MHSFIQKVEYILHQLSDSIKQTFSNCEIFNIFENNKIIILFLINHQILKIDHLISDRICSKVYNNNDFFRSYTYMYCHFFCTEIDNYYQKLEQEED